MPNGRPTLFVIEGLSFYFTEGENKAMLKIIQDCFPGSECLIEIMAAWYVNMMLKMATKKKYADALDNKAGALKMGPSTAEGNSRRGRAPSDL